MNSITLFIPINPVGQERPGSGKYGNRYDPAKSKNFKEQIGQLAHIILKREHPGFKPLEGALSVLVHFYIDRKKMISKKTAAGKIQVPRVAKQQYPVNESDIDNYIKATFDGLNGVLWDDDRAIIQLRDPIKLYADDHPVGIEIDVRPYGAERKDK